MNTRKIILLITLVIPGLAVIGVSLYWFILDYAALGKAENYIEQLARNKQASDRQLDYAYHRTLAHRINVFADGTWGLIGGLIMGLGIHGIATIQEQSQSNNKAE